MPPTSLHMTALEITHSRPPADIATLLDLLAPAIPSLVNLPSSSSDAAPRRRARLIKPLLGFDASALALSFVPAADGEGLDGSGRDSGGRVRERGDDAYTYHHLRRDLCEAVGRAGVEVGSRYVVPSAHLTIGRFIREGDFREGAGGGVDGARVRGLVERIEEVNAWLRREYWPRGEAEAGGIREGGEWVVGEGKGLDCRKGALWYGSGGETVLLGEGF